MHPSPDSVFELESKVRRYSRDFPAVFDRASGSILRDEDGREYIDFLAGAGALNLGHNPPIVIDAVTRHLRGGGLLHALDLWTPERREFLTTFGELILQPRSFDYRVQFCGPTGTNAVEAALKLARIATGRSTIVAFSGSFHGMTGGSLAVTSHAQLRRGLGRVAGDVAFLPFPGERHPPDQVLSLVEDLVEDAYSGVDLPAAIILETVQGEGGTHVAPVEWLLRLREFCTRHRILLICDEVKTGWYRTGPFFSFERAGIHPDLVVLSKSLSGCGLPLAVVLIKPEYDCWQPGEHSGTFRGNQLALVAAAAALRVAAERDLCAEVLAKGHWVERWLATQVAPLHPKLRVRGLGMMWGIELPDAETARSAGDRCFANGLMIERTGRSGDVLSILPPLTIEMPLLEGGCKILAESVIAALSGGAG